MRRARSKTDIPADWLDPVTGIAPCHLPLAIPEEAWTRPLESRRRPGSAARLARLGMCCWPAAEAIRPCQVAGEGGLVGVRRAIYETRAAGVARRQTSTWCGDHDEARGQPYLRQPRRAGGGHRRTPPGGSASRARRACRTEPGPVQRRAGVAAADEVRGSAPRSRWRPQQRTDDRGSSFAFFGRPDRCAARLRRRERPPVVPAEQLGLGRPARRGPECAGPLCRRAGAPAASQLEEPRRRSQLPAARHFRAKDPRRCTITDARAPPPVGVPASLRLRPCPPTGRLARLDLRRAARLAKNLLVGERSRTDPDAPGHAGKTPW